jgi:hypothetical protein
MMNVRAGDMFVYDPYIEQEQKYKDWLKKHISDQKKLFIIEFGAGECSFIIIRSFFIHSFIRSSLVHSSFIVYSSLIHSFFHQSFNCCKFPCLEGN